MTHESIDSIADLGRTIKSWDSVSQWSSPSAGLVSKVQGHLAEALAADHLAEAGHGVGIPVASNHPAWDLDVDQHLTNVKSVADFSSVHEHFAANPDIPVIVPHDAVGIPENAIHFDPATPIDFDAAHEAGSAVFVDDALSHADTVQSTTDGLEVASGHVSVHFPWATAAVSTFREGTLLLKGHTDLGRAAKNVAVDTIAVGGAGAIGAKGGAAIGTAILPGVGTAIGAVVGGLAGALIGRKAANDIKRAPLEEARSSYDGAVSELEREQARAKADAEAAWSATQAEQQRALSAEAAAAKQDIERVVNAAQKALEAARSLGDAQRAAVLDAVQDELVSKVSQLENAAQRFRWWQTWVWPSPSAVSITRLARAFRAFANEWVSARAALDASSSTDPDAIFDLAMATPRGVALARAHIAAVGKLRAGALARCVAARNAAVRRVASARGSAVTILNNKRDEITAQVEARLERPVRSLKGARGHFVSELRKAGVSVEA